MLSLEKTFELVALAGLRFEVCEGVVLLTPSNLASHRLRAAVHRHHGDLHIMVMQAHQAIASAKQEQQA